jgi:hypothetical protein
MSFPIRLQPKQATWLNHFALPIMIKRERPRAIRIAWARALTAEAVRPRSSAMSDSEALEMTSCRSRSSSAEVHAFALFDFFVSVSPGSARFRAVDAAGFFASALAARLPLMVLLCLLFFARERAASPQHVLYLHNQVSYKPLSQRVVGLGCKKLQLIKPMMKIFRGRVHRKALS